MLGIEVYNRKTFIQYFIKGFIQRDLKMLDEMLYWFAPAFKYECRFE